MGLLDKLPKHRMVMNSKSYRMAHPVYALKDVEEHVKVTHVEPGCLSDRIAYKAVKFVRSSFDTIVRYNPQTNTERDWIARVIFLETVAGVPGMVGAMHRHLRSLRTLERDGGWIHHLLQEAENERMHLFFFLHMRNPGIFLRLAITTVQFLFMNAFFVAYFLSPRICHRAVGYVEEEAVHTYTVMLAQLDAGTLPYWAAMKAPAEAIEYYGLKEDASFRDMILAVRADEACHRDVNHHFADIPQWAQMEQEEVYIKDDGQLKFMGTEVNKSSAERRVDIIEDFVHGTSEKKEEQAKLDDSSKSDVSEEKKN